MDEKVMELEFGNTEEYKVETIWDSAVYANETKGHLPGLYYLVAWKRYCKQENTEKLLSAIQHLKKLTSFFHKKHLKESTTTFPPIDFAPPMTRLIIKPIRPTTKRKQSWPANIANKRAKNWVLDTCDIWTILLL